MATQDARISTGLPGHPKTKKLAKRLGVAACWHLVCLFLWTAANRSDGSLAGMTDEDVELAADWSGDDGAFVAALKAVGFLDGADGAYAIHDWTDHNPWATGAEMRSAKASWNAIKRHHGEVEANRRVPEWAAIRDAESNSLHAASNAAADAASTHPALLASNAPSPSPSPSPNQDQKQKSSATPPTADPNDDREDGESPTNRRQALAAAHAERLAQVTRDAMETFNDSKLTKVNGGLVPNVIPGVGEAERRKNIARSLQEVRAICRAHFESEHIVRDFWVEYWELCNEDEHKSGRTGGGKEHGNWLPSFEYLTRPKTLLEVYERAQAAAGGDA